MSPTTSAAGENLLVDATLMSWSGHKKDGPVRSSMTIFTKQYITSPSMKTIWKMVSATSMGSGFLRLTLVVPGPRSFAFRSFSLLPLWFEAWSACKPCSLWRNPSSAGLGCSSGASVQFKASAMGCTAAGFVSRSSSLRHPVSLLPPVPKAVAQRALISGAFFTPSRFISGAKFPLCSIGSAPTRQAKSSSWTSFESTLPRPTAMARSCFSATW
mmetsp:Transcript_89842/g.290777  ORF Transcript_89842/g.290777 Transcript_89842/m.290777 type:complete len:214 (+) Transcript_89842:243-884(+)